jgi:hypothetical protein
MKNYNYVIGEEVVLFEDSKRNEYFGRVVEIRDNTVLCTMGDDTPIEFDKGVVIPIDQVEDLFPTPDLIPDEVQAVLESFDEDCANTYHELDRLLNELEPLGYIFSYYLDAEPFWLRKIITNNLEISK